MTTAAVAADARCRADMTSLSMEWRTSPSDSASVGPRQALGKRSGSDRLSLRLGRLRQLALDVLRARALEVAREAELLEPEDQPVGRVELAERQAMARRRREGVV